jgi:endonuclease/exonuclease/phosphatase (EEP) superfamily protein YafD
MTERARRVAAGVVGVAAWLTVGVLAMTALLRLAHLDRWWPVVALIAFSPWLYGLAVLVAVGALAARRWRLGVGAGLLAVIGLVTVMPSFLPISRAASAAAGSITLRLFDANVRFNNPSVAGIAAEIVADHPDVVTLDEVTPAQVQMLQAAGAFTRLRWHYLLPDAGNGYGLGLWSDLPLRHATEWIAAEHPELSAQLVLPDRRLLTVDAVHTTAPRSGMVSEWRAELAAIAAKATTQPRPLLLAGDFNATAQMYEFSAITKAGLKDAAVELGQGWQMTWSRLVPVIPPLIRIDHVLYSPGLTVTGYRLGHGQGSDHRPLLVTLAVLPGRPGVRR